MSNFKNSYSSDLFDTTKYFLNLSKAVSDYFLYLVKASENPERASLD